MTERAEFPPVRRRDSGGKRPTDAHNPVPLDPPSAAEDDQDLLTYAVAADRLQYEIAQQRELLAELAATRGADSVQSDQVRARIEQLNRVLQRHLAARTGLANERGFFKEDGT